MNSVREPYAVAPHVRFDEKELETQVHAAMGWRLQAADGGGQAAPPRNWRVTWRANSLLYLVTWLILRLVSATPATSAVVLPA